MVVAFESSAADLSHPAAESGTRRRSKGVWRTRGPLPLRLSEIPFHHRKLTRIAPTTCAICSMFNGCQGAISTFGANILVEGATIASNTAGSGAGGGAYCSSSAASFNTSNFVANEAVWGGGEAEYVAGSFAPSVS